MARIPARVMSVALVTADRVELGDGGDATSRPPVIDLANRRLRLTFMLPARLGL
jgi:hypothetical protein